MPNNSAQGITAGIFFIFVGGFLGETYMECFGFVEKSYLKNPRIPIRIR
jgi:hypothetical protein